MNNNNEILARLLKFSLVLVFALSFLQVKMKFGWDPVKDMILRDSCDVNHPSILIESISMQDSMTFNVKESKRLLPQISPHNANNQRLIWSSSDTTIAHVDSNGLVTTTSKGGRCIITASTIDGSNKSDSIIINVDKPVIQITDIKVRTINILNIDSVLTLKPDSKFKVEVEILPKNASNKILKWESSMKSVATVDDHGIIRVNGTGECSISVTSTDGGNAQTKSIKVHVPKPTPVVVKVTSVKLDKSIITMNVGERAQIHADVFPTNATNKHLVWTTENSIATVDNGIIVGVGEGECTIIASTTDGSKISSKVVKKKKKEDLKVSINGSTVEEKVKYCLSYFTNPQNSFTQKKDVANKMKSLFAPSATINIINKKEEDSKLGKGGSLNLFVRSKNSEPSGKEIIQPESGFLACGTSGMGRLADINIIYDAIEKYFTKKQKRAILYSWDKLQARKNSINTKLPTF